MPLILKRQERLNFVSTRLNIFQFNRHIHARYMQGLTVIFARLKINEVLNGTF